MYTELVYTVVVPIDEHGISFDLAALCHEGDEAIELSEGLRELACLNPKCEALNGETGYIIHDGKAVNLDTLV